MERLKELIIQLKEQFDRQAEPSRMLETAKLLQAELQLLASQPAPAKVMPTKIAVMMPSAARIISPSAQIISPSAQINAPSAHTPTAQQAPFAGEHNETIPEPHHEPTPEPHWEPAPVSEPRREPAIGRETVAPRNGVANVPSAGLGNTPGINGTNSTNPAGTPEETITIGKSPERGQWPFDHFAEKPTDRFTLSQRSREVNDVIGSSATSLNDKLKSEVADLKSALNDTPVRDLKKAIGVNDRYVFINQLFRGDEVMYERSLKTINGFRILPEAEYWMERELKVKLGWDENREATRHFYQLVKRRFS